MKEELIDFFIFINYLTTRSNCKRRHCFTWNLDEVATSLQGMLKNLTPLLTTCCIYRVPWFVPSSGSGNGTIWFGVRSPATAPFDSSLAVAVAMAPSDSGFDPRQRRHLIRAQLVSQLIRVQLVLLDWGINQQNL